MIRLTRLVPMPMARWLCRLIAVRARTGPPEAERHNRDQRSYESALQGGAIIRAGCFLVKVGVNLFPV